jgi:hypothetical protein
MVAWCCVRVAELQQRLCEDAQSIRPDRMARKNPVQLSRMYKPTKKNPDLPLPADRDAL